MKDKPFRKDYICWKYVINLLGAFLGPWCLGVPPPRHQIFKIATAVVRKQFRKAANKLYKNLPIFQQLSEAVLLLRNSFQNKSTVV